MTTNSTVSTQNKSTLSKIDRTKNPLGKCNERTTPHTIIPVIRELTNDQIVQLSSQVQTLKRNINSLLKIKCTKRLVRLAKRPKRPKRRETVVLAIEPLPNSSEMEHGVSQARVTQNEFTDTTVDKSISTTLVNSVASQSDEVDKPSERDRRAAKRRRSENKEKSCNMSTAVDMEQDMSADETVNVTTVTDLRSLLNKGKQGLQSRVVKQNGTNLSITLNRAGRGFINQGISTNASNKQVNLISPKSLIRQALLESEMGIKSEFFFSKNSISCISKTYLYLYNCEN